MTIIERAQVMEAIKLHRLREGRNMQKVEDSTSKLTKKIGFKKKFAKNPPRMYNPEASLTTSTTIPVPESDVIFGRLREGGNRVVANMVSGIARRSHKAVGRVKQQIKHAEHEMSEFGKVGLTVVNHHGGVDDAPLRGRKLNMIKHIMNSARAHVGNLREAININLLKAKRHKMPDMLLDPRERLRDRSRHPFPMATGSDRDFGVQQRINDINDVWAVDGVGQSVGSTPHEKNYRIRRRLGISESAVARGRHGKFREALLPAQSLKSPTPKVKVKPLVSVKNPMESMVMRGILQEAALQQAEQAGYKKGASIVANAKDGYGRVNKGNLKAALSDGIVRKGAGAIQGALKQATTRAGDSPAAQALKKKMALRNGQNQGLIQAREKGALPSGTAII